MKGFKDQKVLENVFDLNLSPLDGRYREKVEAVRNIWSERNLNRTRIKTELLWLRFLVKQEGVKKSLSSLSSKSLSVLESIVKNETKIDGIAVRSKVIEEKTRHDVKAVEYAIRECLLNHKFDPNWINMVHFACTSEDINNASYAQMLKSTVELFVGQLENLTKVILSKSKPHYQTPMISRTHGQPASPTSLGKEWLVFALRLSRVLAEVRSFKFYVKFSGAVGNYHAHSAAFPEIDWHKLSQAFIVDELKMEPAICTTQIEPHDYLASICHWLIRLNTVLLDFVKDMWTYVSLDYFVQQRKKEEVGSSTMPHKINPIDFENAEGNLGMAVAMLQYFAGKLPISRLQRDLSDSTVQRSLGVAFGYTMVALRSIEVGMQRLDVNESALSQDLNDRWEVLGEAVQSVLRVEGVENAYELVKEKSRGKKWKEADYLQLVKTLPITDAAHRKYLLQLTPRNYLGQVDRVCKEAEKAILLNLKLSTKR